MKTKPSTEINRYNIDYSTKQFTLTKSHKTDSGFDIKANVSQDVIIKSGEIKTIDTGIIMDIQVGLEAQIRSRSGLAAKHGIVVLNSPGTVDAGYRGEIKITLINHGKESYTIRNGDAIAQIIFAKVLDIEMIQVTNINKTATDRKEKEIDSTEEKKKTGGEKKPLQGGN